MHGVHVCCVSTYDRYGTAQSVNGAKHSWLTVQLPVGYCIGIIVWYLRLGLGQIKCWGYVKNLVSLSNFAGTFIEPFLYIDFMKS